MKLKILVKVIEKLLGMTNSGDGPRADMYLPDRLLAMAMIFIAGGITLVLFAIFKFAVWAVISAPIAIVLGIFALLCWRNQTICVISDTQFTYTTMFGTTHTYSFSDIQGLHKNQDSMTLLVAGEKVHIESMAILSQRLVEQINASLENLRNA